MADKVTERKRKAYESKIEGADKVQIKIIVTSNDEKRAYETLDIRHRDAAWTTKTENPNEYSKQTRILSEYRAGN